MGKDKKSENAGLRQKAEELLKTNTSKSGTMLTEFEMHKLLHELEVHKIELEMQNEELMSSLNDRKRAEESLTASETRYRRLFESAKDGILILDAETGMITDVNPFLIEMLGYSKDQFRDKIIWEIGFFKDIVANQNKFSELQQKEYVRYDDLPLETSDGRKISVEFISNSYFEDNKKVIQCNIRETTIRKQSELALRKSESQLRTLVQTIPDLIWLKDTNGVYLSCNPMFERFFGAKEADIIGKTDYDFVDRELADFFRENDRKAVEAGKPSSNEEWVTFADDGYRAFLDTIKAPIYDSDGKLIGVLGIGHDITERKLAEESLREKEYEFRILAESMPQMVWITQPNGLNIYFNQQWFDYTGQTLEDSYGHGWNKPFHPDDQQRARDAWQNAIKYNDVYSLEARLRRADGVYNWFLVRGVPFLDKFGTILKWFGTCTDINEIKRAEESLKKQKDEFETIFNLVPAQIWYKDTHNNFIRVNQQVCKDIGMTIDQIEGHSAEELFPSFSQQYFTDDLEVISTRKPKLGISEQVNTASGDIRWVHSDKIPVFGNDGEVNGLLAVVQDITDRKRTEEALRKSEEKFRSYIDNAPDGVFVIDESGRYIDVNNAACTMSGYSENEFLKMSISDLLAEESFEAGLAHFNELIQYGKLKSDLSIKHKDGSIRWWSLDAVKLTESRFLGFSKDITERKKAEDVLRERESQLSETQLVAKVGSWTTDLTTLKVSWSAETYRIFEIDADSFQASHQAFLEFVHPEDRAKVNAAFALSLNNHSINTIEHRILTLNGKTKFVEEYWQIIRDDQGNPIRAVGSCQDITERKRAEKEITMLAHSLKSINECVSITDQDDKILFVNESFLKTYGYTVNELIGKNISIVRSQVNEKKSVDEILPATILGEWQGELLNRRKDGSEFPIYLSTTIIKDKESKILGLIGVATDITERKHTEEVLRQSEAKFRNLINSLPDPVLVVDSQGRIVYCNENAMKTFDYNNEEMLNCTMEDLIPIHFRKQHITLRNKYISEPRSRAMGEGKELFAQRKGGSEFPTEIMLEPVEINNHLFTLAIVRDITERKKIEQEIKFQANLLSNVGQSVIATDLLGNIIYWNTAAEKMYGWSSAEAIGQNIISLTPAQTTQEQAAEIMKNLSDGNSWTGEFLVKRKDGSSFPVLVTDAPFFNLKKELAGIIGISSDITERKLAETELIEAKEKAQESDRLKSAFLANMSHEVRTPLNSIIGFSELLADPDFDGDEKDEFIQHIIGSGNNLLNIISDIMDISKIESGEITIRKQHINAHEYVLAIYERFSLQVGTQKLELILNIPDNDKETEILADTDRLSQIFNNLIGNALKFTAKGSIEIGYRKKNKMVEFFVKDTGIGISASYHHKIFDRFRQVEDSKTRKYGGNGLGLAITKNMVGLMGGKIWVDSEEGKGSNFYFTMPCNS